MRDSCFGFRWRQTGAGAFPLRRNSLRVANNNTNTAGPARSSAAHSALGTRAGFIARSPDCKKQFMSPHNATTERHGVGGARHGVSRAVASIPADPALQLCTITIAASTCMETGFHHFDQAGLELLTSALFSAPLGCTKSRSEMRLARATAPVSARKPRNRNTAREATCH
ncbi:hypothetical protein AAY473_025217 [Plecturocebus cupreus]